jgi:hypothetical protein
MRLKACRSARPRNISSSPEGKRPLARLPRPRAALQARRVFRGLARDLLPNGVYAALRGAVRRARRAALRGTFGRTGFTRLCAEPPVMRGARPRAGPSAERGLRGFARSRLSCSIYAAWRGAVSLAQPFAAFSSRSLRSPAPAPLHGSLGLERPRPLRPYARPQADRGTRGARASALAEGARRRLPSGASPRRSAGEAARRGGTPGPPLCFPGAERRRRGFRLVRAAARNVSSREADRAPPSSGAGGRAPRRHSPPGAQR